MNYFFIFLQIYYPPFGAIKGYSKNSNNHCTLYSYTRYHVTLIVSPYLPVFLVATKDTATAFEIDQRTHQERGVVLRTYTALLEVPSMLSAHLYERIQTPDKFTPTYHLWIIINSTSCYMMLCEQGRSVGVVWLK